MATGQHSAAASAAGYLYQTNWALLDLLRKSSSRPDHAITLEMHDDVAWTDDGDATELLQIKLHAKAAAGMGDKDVDVWKTLGIWMSRDDCTDPHGADLALVTTSIASPGTATYALRPGGSRNVPLAAQLLVAAAQESTNQDTKSAREKFISLTSAERTIFLERVRVLDAQLSPDDLDTGVRTAIAWGLPVGERAQNRFVAEIWRWWAAVSIDMLAGRRSAVGASEALTFVQELRNGYTNENLPTTVQLDDVTDTDVKQYDDARFVAQLSLVNYSGASLRLAVIDYHRAIAQETEWLDDNLLNVHELRNFEKNLRFEWDRAFNSMLEDIDDLDMDPVDLAKEKVRAGRRLLNSLLASTAVNVRKHYNEAFYGRGKRHELADMADTTLGIGWHPEFAARLEAVVVTV